MNKGEVVEEGDHDTLMRSRGIYYGLVEQQNLRRAEEEEQINFERQESTGLVQAHQADENHLDDALQRKRASTIISLTPSVIAALYGKKDNPTADEDKEEGEKEKRKKVKIKVRLILIKIILLGKKT